MAPPALETDFRRADPNVESVGVGTKAKTGDSTPSRKWNPRAKTRYVFAAHRKQLSGAVPFEGIARTRPSVLPSFQTGDDGIERRKPGVCCETSNTRSVHERGDDQLDCVESREKPPRTHRWKHDTDETKI